MSYFLCADNFCIHLGFIKKFFYCCSITFVPFFLPLLSPALPTPPLPNSVLTPPLSLSMVPLYMFLDLFPSLPVTPFPTFFFLFYFFKLFYCCSITVDCIFPLHSPCPSQSHLPPLLLHSPLVLTMCHLY